MNIFKKYLNDQRGASILELIIASGIGLIALAITISVFIQQQSLLKDENDGTKVRAKGRQAIKILAREIRMAGYGLPPGEAMTDIATANSISFRTNLTNDRREASTWIDQSGTGIADTDTSLTVVDGTDFLNGDKIVVYQTGWFRSKFFTANGNGTSTTINLADSGGSSTAFGSPGYTFGTKANLITVNKYDNWTIALVGDEIQKTIDGANTTVLINELRTTSSGLQFDYVGILEATTSKIGITLNLLDPKNYDAAIEFKTDVTLRNLGIKG